MVGFLVFVLQLLTLGTETRVLPVPKLCPGFSRVWTPPHYSHPYIPSPQGHLSRSSGQEEPNSHFYLLLPSTAFAPSANTVPRSRAPDHPPPRCYNIISSPRGVRMESSPQCASPWPHAYISIPHIASSYQSADMVGSHILIPAQKWVETGRRVTGELGTEDINDPKPASFPTSPVGTGRSQPSGH